MNGNEVIWLSTGLYGIEDSFANWLCGMGGSVELVQAECGPWVAAWLQFQGKGLQRSVSVAGAAPRVLPGPTRGGGGKHGTRVGLEVGSVPGRCRQCQAGGGYLEGGRWAAGRVGWLGWRVPGTARHRPSSVHLPPVTVVSVRPVQSVPAHRSVVGLPTMLTTLVANPGECLLVTFGLGPGFDFIGFALRWSQPGASERECRRLSAPANERIGRPAERECAPGWHALTCALLAYSLCPVLICRPGR